MRILLVNPNVLKPVIPPLGLEYVGEHLTAKGHDISLVDRIETVEIEAIIHSTSPDFIGFQVRNLDNAEMLNQQFYLPEIKEQIAHVKQLTDTPIVVGGTAVNLMPDEVRRFVGADYAIAGKGFKALDDFVEKLERGERPPPVTTDFSDIVNGIFKRTMINYTPYLTQGAMIGVATKFGCPHNCTYCDYPVVDGKAISQRPPYEIAQEVANLKSRGVNYIFFADANFNIPARHGTDVLNALRETGIEIVWDAFLNPHPKSFTDEFFEALVMSGKTHVNLGVDSLHNPTLDYLQKKFNVADVARATELCKKNGVKVSYSLLFGSPIETEESVHEVFEQLDKLQPDSVTVDIGLRIYRETPLYTQLLTAKKIDHRTDILKPCYVPVEPRLIELVQKEIATRSFCEAPNLRKYMIPAHS